MSPVREDLASGEKIDRHTKVWDQDPPVKGLAKASQAPPADETGAVYAALSGELAACRLSAFRPESCQKPAAKRGRIMIQQAKCKFFSRADATMCIRPEEPVRIRE